MILKIHGPKIYSNGQWLENQALMVEGQTIKTFNHDNSDETLEFSKDHFIIPGFIDMHIHGAKGADTMDATVEALDTITSTLPLEGTTSFLTSTMTATNKDICNALKNVADYPNKAGAEILGIHLEGPFLSPRRVGAQRKDLLQDPNVEVFKLFQQASDNLIKVVTLAPELPGAFELIDYLVYNNITAAVGHSDADYKTTKLAIEKGCHHATHLFNAMGRFHYRDPGTTGALLFSPDVTAELIVDEHHLHPDVVDMTYQLKGEDRTILVTDAMRAKCCGEGKFELGGQPVIVKDDAARLESGNLAGSILRMNQAARNMQRDAHCPFEAIIQMTSLNQAKLLNVENRKGDLNAGKDADFIVVDANFEVKATFCRGQTGIS